MPKSNFYLIGLGLLMADTAFTQEEQDILAQLCKYAAKSDAQYWDAIQVISRDPTASRALERLKQTLRSLNKAPILQAHYDRAAQL